jgi:protein O-GlcNAc transferase
MNNGRMTSEQQLINQFHKEMTINAVSDYLIKKINKKHSKSVVLNYYLGEYYLKIQSPKEAEKYLRKTIDLEPKFSASYFPLADLLIKLGQPIPAEKLLLNILGKKTLNQLNKLDYNHDNDLRICNTLIPIVENKEHLYEMGSRAYKSIKTGNSENHSYVYKNICLGWSKDLPKKEAYELCIKGLNTMHTDDVLDKQLVQAALMYSHYVFPPPSPPVEKVNQLYRQGGHSSSSGFTNHKKIRIGYLSPDINKNAVSLFCTALFKYYDPAKFEIYCFYNLEKYDEFTHRFKEYVENWYDVYSLSDQELYNLIKHDCEIDILVDLIAHGVGNRMEVIAMQPAPKIINYLGYPGTTGLRSVTHRITDSIADPITSTNCTEKLLRMPRCFMCYTVLPGVHIPEIVPKRNEIHVGVFNKSAKQNPYILGIWKTIFNKRKDFILCVKLDFKQTNQRELYSDFPNVKFFEPQEKLDDYLSLFNQVDFCIDTYPYSGTTTTCSALLMGVPTYTMYVPGAKHVSNVSTSIMTQIDKNYVCKNVGEYCDKIGSFSSNDKQTIRQKFLRLMEPEKFMREYEELLSETEELETGVEETGVEETGVEEFKLLLVFNGPYITEAENLLGSIRKNCKEL